MATVFVWPLRIELENLKQCDEKEIKKPQS